MMAFCVQSTLLILSLVGSVQAGAADYFSSTWRTSMEQDSHKHGLRGQFVDVKVDGKPMAMYMTKPFARLPRKDRPAVIVAHHAVGIYHQNFLRSYVDDLADHGYVALLPDFFHRAWSDDVVTGAGEPFEKMNIGALLGSLDDKQILADLSGVLDFIAADPEIRSDKVAVLGFCMGGRIAWLAAVEASFKGKIHAAVPYHGGNVFKGLGTNSQAPSERIKDGLHVPVLGHFGALDKNPSLEDMAKLQELAGDQLQVMVHPDSDHGFSCKDSAKYVESAAAAAWTETIKFLKIAIGDYAQSANTEL